MSLLLVPLNWTGAYHYARGEYALCVVCALTQNLLGAGYGMDVLLWLAPSARARAWVRELIVFCALVFTPAELRYLYGGDEDAYCAILLLLSGRAEPASALFLAFAMEFVGTHAIVCPWLVWRWWPFAALLALLLPLPRGLAYYVAAGAFDAREPPRWLARAAIGVAAAGRVITLLK